MITPKYVLNIKLVSPEIGSILVTNITVVIFCRQILIFISGSLLLGNTVWAQGTEHTVFINVGQEKVQCFPDDMTSSLIGESSLKVMTALF